MSRLFLWLRARSGEVRRKIVLDLSFLMRLGELG